MERRKGKRGIWGWCLTSEDKRGKRQICKGQGANRQKATLSINDEKVAFCLFANLPNCLLPLEIRCLRERSDVFHQFAFQVGSFVPVPGIVFGEFIHHA